MRVCPAPSAAQSFGSSRLQALAASSVLGHGMFDTVLLQLRASPDSARRPGPSCGLSHGRVYFRHPDDTFRGHCSGRLLHRHLGPEQTLLCWTSEADRDGKPRAGAVLPCQPQGVPGGLEGHPVGVVWSGRLDNVVASGVSMQSLIGAVPLSGAGRWQSLRVRLRPMCGKVLGEWGTRHTDMNPNS